MTSKPQPTITMPLATSAVGAKAGSKAVANNNQPIDKRGR